jgi:magnesium chelatase subunit I
VHKPVKAEVRDNLLARLAAGQSAFPGILGFDDTVLPQVERALLAGHDLVLLGERGQGKTRLIRTLTGLLDEWTPVLAGSELNEHPYAPISPEGKRLVAEHGDAAPVTWKHRATGTARSSATPDTSVGDLIGDVDPIKVARAARWATRRPCTTAWCRAPTAGSSASTSCPTWPSGSRSRC